MRRPLAGILCGLLFVLAACSDADSGAEGSTPSSPDGAGGLTDARGAEAEASDAGSASTDAADAGRPDRDAARDGAAIAECYSAAGAAGRCLTASACTSTVDQTSTTVPCATANTECCVDTPDTADNPPIPAGYKPLTQSQVTPEMTTWAVSILRDPLTYRMFDAVSRAFGTLLVLARVEWHPPDFQNGAIHRGVTLYEPI
jgi:hypothetical protein